MCAAVLQGHRVCAGRWAPSFSWKVVAEVTFALQCSGDTMYAGRCYPLYSPGLRALRCVPSTEARPLGKVVQRPGGTMILPAGRCTVRWLGRCCPFECLQCIGRQQAGAIDSARCTTTCPAPGIQAATGPGSQPQQFTAHHLLQAGGTACSTWTSQWLSPRTS